MGASERVFVLCLKISTNPWSSSWGVGGGDGGGVVVVYACYTWFRLMMMMVANDDDCCLCAAVTVCGCVTVCVWTLCMYAMACAFDTFELVRQRMNVGIYIKKRAKALTGRHLLLKCLVVHYIGAVLQHLHFSMTNLSSLPLNSRSSCAVCYENKLVICCDLGFHSIFMRACAWRVCDWNQFSMMDLLVLFSW